MTDQRIILPERPKISGSTEELEAETVSYLISTRLRLIKRSEEYIAGYLKNMDDLMQFSYELVIKVADKIENTFLIPIRSKIVPEQKSLFY